MSDEQPFTHLTLVGRRAHGRRLVEGSHHAGGGRHGRRDPVGRRSGTPSSLETFPKATLWRP